MKGVIRVCMTSKAKGFPNSCADNRQVVNASDPVDLTFSNTAPGSYAIAVIHDENNNGKMDLAMGLMPREGFGFSRDAKVGMGPPSFKSAAFDVNGGTINQTIHMRYML